MARLEAEQRLKDAHEEIKAAQFAYKVAKAVASRIVDSSEAQGKIGILECRGITIGSFGRSFSERNVAEPSRNVVTTNSFNRHYEAGTGKNIVFLCFGKDLKDCFMNKWMVFRDESLSQVKRATKRCPLERRIPTHSWLQKRKQKKRSSLPMLLQHIQRRRSRKRQKTFLIHLWLQKCFQRKERPFSMLHPVQSRFQERRKTIYILQNIQSRFREQQNPLRIHS